MNKELDISFLKFTDGWTGVRVMYAPGKPSGTMEVHSWNETHRFGIDLVKGVATSLCPIDSDELKTAIFEQISPKLEGR